MAHPFANARNGRQHGSELGCDRRINRPQGSSADEGGPFGPFRAGDGSGNRTPAWPLGHERARRRHSRNERAAGNRDGMAEVAWVAIVQHRGRPPGFVARGAVRWQLADGDAVTGVDARRHAIRHRRAIDGQRGERALGLHRQQQENGRKAFHRRESVAEAFRPAQGAPGARRRRMLTPGGCGARAAAHFPFPPGPAGCRRPPPPVRAGSARAARRAKRAVVRVRECARRHAQCADRPPR